MMINDARNARSAPGRFGHVVPSYIVNVILPLTLALIAGACSIIAAYGPAREARKLASKAPTVVPVSLVHESREDERARLAARVAQIDAEDGQS